MVDALEPVRRYGVKGVLLTIVVDGDITRILYFLHCVYFTTIVSDPVP